MKFSTHEDVSLSASDLFAAISDFSRFELVLRSRGVEVNRTGEAGAQAWHVRFDWRGAERNIDLMLVSVTPTERVELAGRSDMFELNIVMAVAELAPGRSRFSFDVQARPRGMSARLLMQTAKLNRAKIDRKFAKRVGEYLGRITASQDA